MNANTPTDLDLKKDRGLTVQWADGTGSYYSIAYLRRMSPSADMRELRRHMAQNPLTVLPDIKGDDGNELTATNAELVGNYAIKITFSDGHNTGIYTWDYLREIDPANQPLGENTPTLPTDKGPGHDNPLGFGHRPPPQDDPQQ